MFKLQRRLKAKTFSLLCLILRSDLFGKERKKTGWKARDLKFKPWPSLRVYLCWMKIKSHTTYWEFTSCRKKYVFNNPYPCAKSLEWAAVCVRRWIGRVEIMATGARSKIEVFSCVNPVSPIRAISTWFQYIGSFAKRYKTPAERGRGYQRCKYQQCNKK